MDKELVIEKEDAKYWPCLLRRLTDFVPDEKKENYTAGITINQLRKDIFDNIEIVKNKNTKEAYPSTLRLGYQIYKKALKKGVLLRPLGDVIYFNPPLIIQPDDMDFVTDVAKSCMTDVLGI